jgi:uncharacterized membrane protein required for colicin V production
MFMNILVVLFVLGVGYAWMVRGVFNSMIHALCVFIAGAVAFAFWEPLALMLVKMSPERGFLSFVESVAWGVALVVPFVVVMLLLRVATDKLIPNNIKNNTMVDYAGGAVFGLVTGVISAGIMVIAVGNMRVPTDFMGYSPLNYTEDRAQGAGSLVKSDSLWVPVDSIVSMAYGNLSEGSMSTAQPLKYWYPELEQTGYASRVSPDGMGRNALRPEDFTIKGRYTVGPESGVNSTDLLKIPGRDTPQRYLDINEEPVGKARVFGYVVEFEAGAKERGKRGAGQLIISNGHMRLLVENTSTGDTFTIFPSAVISESSEPGQFGRWRFDANEVYISSTGGKSKVPMAFEYIVPTGSSPVALFVKNIRVNVDDFRTPVSYSTINRRDDVVGDGAILKGEASEIEYNDQYTVNYSTGGADDSFYDVSSRLMDVLSIQSARRGFTVDDDQQVVGGQGIWDVKTEVGRKNAGTSKKLRVERYALASDQSLLKLDVSANSPFGLLTEAAQIAPLDQTVKLIDTNGAEYEAIGFEYKDSSEMRIRYTLGNTLAGLEDTPSLSTTRSDQRMRLLFVVTRGVLIEKFVIGDTLIAEFDPPIDATSF